jgi:hypothetical protein
MNNTVVALSIVAVVPVVAAAICVVYLVGAQWYLGSSIHLKNRNSLKAMWREMVPVVFSRMRVRSGNVESKKSNPKVIQENSWSEFISAK